MHCIPCLEKDIRVAETLIHVLFRCPVTEEGRVAARAAGISLSDFCGVLLHHRDRWPWSKLRAIRRWFCLAAELRKAAQPVDDLTECLWAGTATAVATSAGDGRSGGLAVG